MTTKQKSAEELERESIEKFEDEQINILKEKLDHYEKEKELKQKLDMRRTDPDFEYENDEDWIEHRRKAGIITIKEEIIRIRRQLDDMFIKKKRREESDKKKRGEV